MVVLQFMETVALDQVKGMQHKSLLTLIPNPMMKQT